MLTRPSRLFPPDALRLRRTRARRVIYYSKKLLMTCFCPRRWAFSIWGLIFFLERLGTIYQLLPYGYSADSMKARIVNAIGGRPCAVCSAACCVHGVLLGSERDRHGGAGYGWVFGWVGEMAWQLLFLLQSPPGARHDSAGSGVWQRVHRSLSFSAR
jgi:hypothetical protein